MIKPLFEFRNGEVSITPHIKNIWIYRDLVEKYGEKVCLRIFLVFHYMADLTLENPYKDVSEVEKLEVIIRGTCPDLNGIDWNDRLIEEGIEYTRKLYETQTYRKYLASKTLLDKLIYNLEHSHIDTSKESGNSAELKRGYELFNLINAQTEKLYQDYLSEQGIKVRGQGMVGSENFINDGKELELE